MSSTLVDEFEANKQKYQKLNQEYLKNGQEITQLIGATSRVATDLSNAVINGGNYITNVLSNINSTTDNISESLATANTQMIQSIQSGSTNQKKSIKDSNTIEAELNANENLYNDVQMSNRINDAILEQQVLNEADDDDGDDGSDPWGSTKMQTDDVTDMASLVQKYINSNRVLTSNITKQRAQKKKLEEKKNLYEKIQRTTKANLEKKINDTYKDAIADNITVIDNKLSNNIQEANSALSMYSSNTSQIVENQMAKKTKNDIYKIYISKIADANKADEEIKVVEKSSEDLDDWVNLAKLKGDKIVGNADIQYSSKVDEIAKKTWNLPPTAMDIIKQLQE